MFDADGDDRIGLLDLEAAMAPGHNTEFLLVEMRWAKKHVDCFFSMFFWKGWCSVGKPGTHHFLGLISLFGRMIF